MPTRLACPPPPYAKKRKRERRRFFTHHNKGGEEYTRTLPATGWVRQTSPLCDRESWRGRWGMGSMGPQRDTLLENGMEDGKSGWAGGNQVSIEVKLDLSPCVVCARQLRVKWDLLGGGFGACDGCGGRVCCGGGREHRGEEMEESGGEGNEDGRGNRECGGCAPHCEVICSRCCVERGEEGEVRCLGCLWKEGE